MIRLRNNKAFTLIELVMVIVILGILAAAAIPKFADLTTSANEAAMIGVVGSVRSGISIVRSENLVKGLQTATFGYPPNLEIISTGPHAATSAAPLFDAVLSQGGITDGWTSVAGGTMSYNYDAIPDTTWIYTNSTGTFIK